MAFTSTLKFFAKFDQTPLIDAVTTRSLDVVGEGEVELLSGGFGYQMQEQQYLRLVDLSLSITNEASFGFWLNPVNPGVVRNPSDNIQSLRMSVMDIRGVDGDIIAHIYEETESDGSNNRLRIDLEGTTASLTSSQYSISQWHYFWVVYNGSS